MRNILRNSDVEEATEIQIEQDVPEHIEVWSVGQHVHFGPSSRTIGFIGEVNQDTASAFITQLSELVIQDDTAPIFIHINTEGGSAVDGMVIYDMIKACPVPVCGVVLGGCMSAGLMILSACDFRIASKHSMFFYHQCVMSMIEAASEAEVESKALFYKDLNQKNDELIRERAGISKKVWKKDFEGSVSKYLTADEALRYGLIDYIIEPADKKKAVKEFITALTES